VSKTIERYYLQLQPLTPIHIGSGEEIMPYEYIVDDDGKYYRIDLFELLNVMPPEKREELVKIMEKDLVEVRSSIADYNWQSSVIYQGKTSSDFATDYNKNIKRSANNLAIDEFINSKRRPYIPGSSLKGAFRTAYLHKFADNINYQISRNRAGFFNVRDSRRKAQQIESGALEYRDFFGDPFQTVKFSDSSLNIDNMEIHKTYSVNVTKENSNGIPYYQETVSGLLSSNVEQNIFAELSIDKARQDNNYGKNSVRHSISAKDLLSATKEFSKKLIEAELNYLRSNTAPTETIRIYQHLKSIHADLEENESLIRFGKGIGFNSTTLNLSNKRTTVNPVSRVLADHKFPMGWAVFSLNEEKHDVSILNNKEIKEKSKKMEKKKEEKIKKKKENYPKLMDYIKGEYGKSEAKKATMDRMRGKGKLYKKYKREYEKYLKG
jgi:CRISPR-associated protein Csm5